MAASLKVSELTALSSVAAADLFLIADSSATASKKVTLTNLEGSMSLANLGTRAISDLSNVASTSPSSGEVLAWNGSAWAPADPGHSTQASLGVDHLITLSGVSEGSDDLGTFSGSTITDSSTIKTALQELETAVEGSVGGATTVTVVSTATNANHYLTFVDSNNVSGTQETVYTDAGVYYNPFTNQFTANGVNTGVLSINSVDVTSTAAELNVLDGITSTTAELNILDGVTATASELNLVDGTTAGTVVASKAVAVDANKDITGFRNITLTGELDAATLDVSGDVDIDGTTNLDAVDIDGAVQVDGTLTVGSTGGGGTDYSTATGDAFSSTFDGTYTRHTGFTLDTASPSGSSALFNADSTYAYFVMSNDNSKMLIFSEATLSGEWVFVHKSGADFRSSQLSDNDALGSTTSVSTDMFSSGTTTVDSVKYPTADNSTWTYGTLGSSYDVQFYGATSGASVQWDASVDDLIAAGDARIVVPEGNLVLGSTAVTSTAAELNVLDGVTAFVDEDNMASDSATSIPSQQSVKAYVDANETHIDNLATLSGVSKDSTNLGSFSGTTITDNTTIKTALQDLETELESVGTGGAQAASVATVTRATDATHFLTFVQDDNGSSTQETVHTDAGVVYNPSSNLLTVGALTVSGDLTIQGTTTTIDSTTVQIDDKNIELGTVASPSDTTADGGGITLKGATDKTINWINSTDNWTSSESFDLVSGKEYKINNVSVLSSTTLGSAVVNSSLTSVGTLTALTVSGTTNLTGTFQLGGTSVTATAAELNILDGVTATAAELNILDGVTSTAAELNILDGVTATASELNILDGVTSTTAELNILDGVTSTAAEINILDGVTATTDELNVLDGVTAFVDEDNMASDSATSIPSQQSVKAYVDANEVHIDNIVTLSGVSKDATNLGTFTGSTIADTETVKGALQDLEDAIEGPLPDLVEVHNDTGSTLTKGQVVYVSGTHSSGKPTVALADADASGKTPAIGLIAADISDGADGNVVTSGLISGLNTSALSAGDALYVHTTAGAYTSTRPTAAGTEVQKVAIVSRSHVSAGSLLVMGAGRANDVPNELTALTGVALDAQNLGTFSGSIIADNETIKGALQDLEDGLSTISLANVNINGGSAITIADADKVPFYDVSGTTNGNTTATLLADYVASKKTVKQLANVGTTADSEPTNYFFLAVDASNGNIVILNKEFVETEGSP